jgi:iturin family lipopeptide synthetase A
MFDGGLLKNLKTFASGRQSTLFMVLFATYGVLLHRLSQRREIVVGFAVSGRTMPGCEGMIGYCNHLLPMRLIAESSASFTEYLASVRTQVLEAYDHQQYPFASLLNRLNAQREGAARTLLTSTFNLEPPIRLPKRDGLRAELLPSPIGYTGGDLHLNVTELPGELLVHIDYDRDLFESATMARTLGQYRVLLESILLHDAQPLWALPMLTEAERKILLDT